MLDVAGDVAVAGDRRSLDGLVVAVGPNRLTGSLAKAGDAPATGRLTLDAPDIAPVAALALVEATGALDADITLDAAEVGQGVSLVARARGLAVGETAVGEPRRRRPGRGRARPADGAGHAGRPPT